MCCRELVHCNEGTCTTLGACGLCSGVMPPLSKEDASNLHVEPGNSGPPPFVASKQLAAPRSMLGQGHTLCYHSPVKSL